MLNFPLDYQTQYYVNKAVSCFGQLFHWHNPRVNKAWVLVKVMIKQLRLVLFSLVVTHVSALFGIAGRSWSLPLYVLNGRSVAPDAIGDEDHVPPLNVSPHPYALPFLSEMQQHNLDVQVWHQQNAAIPWEAAMPPPLDHNQEWDAWLVVVPEYRGLSLRSLTGYAGPSMMDGVSQEHNITDDPLTWSPVVESEHELAEIEAIADNVVNGRDGGTLTIVQMGALEISEVEELGGGSVQQAVEILNSNGEASWFPSFFRFLQKRIYCFTPKLLNNEDPLKITSTDSSQPFLFDIDQDLFYQACMCGMVFFAATIRRLYCSVSLIDIAVRYEAKKSVFPAFTSAEGRGWFELNLDGSLVWFEQPSFSSDLGSGLNYSLGSHFEDSSSSSADLLIKFLRCKCLLLLVLVVAHQNLPLPECNLRSSAAPLFTKKVTSMLNYQMDHLCKRSLK
jgi:hypothetical protein